MFKYLIRTYWIGPAMADRGGVVSLVGAGDAIGAAGARRLPGADTRPASPGATRPDSKYWARVDGRAAHQRIQRRGPPGIRVSGSVWPARGPSGPSGPGS